MIPRRTAMLGGLALPLLAACQEGQRPVAAAPDAPPRPAAAPEEGGPMRLVYLWAWNCPACPRFDARFIRPYEESPAAQRVPVVRVGVPTFQSPFRNAEDHWPEDLQWLRAEHAARGLRGTPRTMLIQGRTTLYSAFGWGDLERLIMPRIQRELA